MPRALTPVLIALGVGTLACTASAGPSAVSPVAPGPTLAQIYLWRARAGKLDEYNRYIQEVAEPIDHLAGRRGAFVSVTTYVSRDTTSAWTHMRVFLLRDSTQLAGLAAALDRAGVQLEPDSTKRRVRGDYAATLRDRVGALTVTLLP